MQRNRRPASHNKPSASFNNSKLGKLLDTVNEYLENNNRANNLDENFKKIFEQFIFELNRDLKDNLLTSPNISNLLTILAKMVRISRTYHPFKALLDDDKTKNSIQELDKKAFEIATSPHATLLQVAEWCEWKTTSNDIKEKQRYEINYPQKMHEKIIHLSKNHNNNSKIMAGDVSRICHWLSFHERLNSQEMQLLVTYVNRLIAKMTGRCKSYRLNSITDYLLKLNHVPETVRKKIIAEIEAELSSIVYYNELNAKFAPHIFQFFGLYYTKYDQNKEFILSLVDKIQNNIIHSFNPSQHTLLITISSLTTFYSVLDKKIITDDKIAESINNFVKLIETTVNEKPDILTEIDIKYLCSFKLELRKKNSTIFDSTIQRLDKICDNYNNIAWNTYNSRNGIVAEKKFHLVDMDTLGVVEQNPYYFFQETHINLKLGKQFFTAYWEKEENQSLCIAAHRDYFTEQAKYKNLTEFKLDAQIPNGLLFSILLIDGNPVCTVNVNPMLQQNAKLVTSIKKCLEELNKKKQPGDIPYQFIDAPNLKTNVNKFTGLPAEKWCVEKTLFHHLITESLEKKIQIESMSIFKLYPDTKNTMQSSQESIFVKPLPADFTYTDKQDQEEESFSLPCCDLCVECKPEILSLLKNALEPHAVPKTVIESGKEEEAKISNQSGLSSKRKRDHEKTLPEKARKYFHPHEQPGQLLKATLYGPSKRIDKFLNDEKIKFYSNMNNEVKNNFINDLNNFKENVKKELNYLSSAASAQILSTFNNLARKISHSKELAPIYNESKELIHDLENNIANQADSASWLSIATWCDSVTLSHSKADFTKYQSENASKILKQIALLDKLSITNSSSTSKAPTHSSIIRIANWFKNHPFLNSINLDSTVNALNTQISKLNPNNQFKMYEIDHLISYLLKLNYVPSKIVENTLAIIITYVKNNNVHHSNKNLAKISLFIALYYANSSKQDNNFIIAFKNSIQDSLESYKFDNEQHFSIYTCRIATLFSRLPDISDSTSKRCISSLLFILEKYSDKFSLFQIEHLLDFYQRIKKNDDYAYEAKRLNNLFREFRKRIWDTFSSRGEKDNRHLNDLQIGAIESENPLALFINTDKNISLAKEFFNLHWSIPENKELCKEAQKEQTLIHAKEKNKDKEIDEGYAEPTIPSILLASEVMINDKKFFIINLNRQMTKNEKLMDALRKSLIDLGVRHKDIEFKLIEDSDIDETQKFAGNVSPNEWCEDKVFLNFVTQEITTTKIQVISSNKYVFYPFESRKVYGAGKDCSDPYARIPYYQTDISVKLDNNLKLFVGENCMPCARHKLELLNMVDSARRTSARIRDIQKKSEIKIVNEPSTQAMEIISSTLPAPDVTVASPDTTGSQEVSPITAEPLSPSKRLDFSPLFWSPPRKPESPEKPTSTNLSPDLEAIIPATPPSESSINMELEPAENANGNGPILDEFGEIHATYLCHQDEEMIEFLKNRPTSRIMILGEDNSDELAKQFEEAFAKFIIEAFEGNPEDYEVLPVTTKNKLRGDFFAEKFESRPEIKKQIHQNIQLKEMHRFANSTASVAFHSNLIFNKLPHHPDSSTYQSQEFDYYEGEVRPEIKIDFMDEEKSPSPKLN